MAPQDTPRFDGLDKSLDAIAKPPEQASANETADIATGSTKNEAARNALVSSLSAETQRGGLDTIIDAALKSDITPGEKAQLNTLKSVLPNLPKDQVAQLYKEYTDGTKQANLAIVGVAVGCILAVAAGFIMNKPNPERDARELAKARSLSETQVSSINNKKLDQYAETSLRLYTGDNRADFKQAVLNDPGVVNAKNDYINNSGTGKNKEFMKTKEDAYNTALQSAIANEQGSRDQNGFKN